MRNPDVAAFHDERTGSILYVVADPAAGKCAVIDSVLDFDERSGTTATKQADAILEYVAKNGLSVQWILDTHPHADHFSAAPYAAPCFRRQPRGLGFHLWKNGRGCGSGWPLLRVLRDGRLVSHCPRAAFRHRHRHAPDQCRWLVTAGGGRFPYDRGGQLCAVRHGGLGCHELLDQRRPQRGPFKYRRLHSPIRASQRTRQDPPSAALSGGSSDVLAQL